MERKIIADQIAEEVIGGSIVFSGDRTTCGRNCNNQYKVNDFDAVKKYILGNYTKMSEQDMLDNLAAQGLLTKL